MNFTVLRNNTKFVINLCDLQSNDLVLAQNGWFYPVSSFPELNNYFYQPVPALSDILIGIGKFAFATIGIIGVLDAIDGLFNPYNNEPLTQRTRDYIRQRDGEICAYCKNYAPNGHVDHRISRFNGGSNDFDNLAWACASCNCSKGKMNDYEFLECYEWV